MRQHASPVNLKERCWTGWREEPPVTRVLFVHLLVKLMSTTSRNERLYWQHVRLHYIGSVCCCMATINCEVVGRALARATLQAKEAVVVLENGDLLDLGCE